MWCRILNGAIVGALLVSLVLLAACGVGPPTAGEWKAKTDFGSFAFEVSADGRTITRVTYNMERLSCGGVTQSGTVSTEYRGGREIENRKISFEVTIGSGGPPQPPNPMSPASPRPSTAMRLEITGQFDAEGTRASGDWQVTANGQDCASGTWQAVPGE